MERIRLKREQLAEITSLKNRINFRKNLLKSNYHCNRTKMINEVRILQDRLHYILNKIKNGTDQNN